MSENKNVVFCTQCGSENDANSKFCASCGTKLEALVQPDNSATSSEERNVYAEGLFSGGEATATYESPVVEASPEPATYTEEININYSEPSINNSYYEQPSTPYEAQYYSSNQAEEKITGGYIGVSIASLVCGILSILCCCLSCVGLVFAIASVVLGIITLVNKYDGKGMAIAGLATAGVGLVLTIATWVGVSSGAFDDFLYEIIDSLDMY